MKRKPTAKRLEKIFGVKVNQAERRFTGARGSVTDDARLCNAVTALMEIVEGCKNIRWQHEGRRLVDTPQWCNLYVAWCAEKRKSPNEKGQPQPPTASVADTKSV